jgi:hypothetical protein
MHKVAALTLTIGSLLTTMAVAVDNDPFFVEIKMAGEGVAGTYCSRCTAAGTGGFAQRCWWV